MTLTSETYIDKIEILSDGQIQVREARQILEDGVPVGSPKLHRYVLDPGSDDVTAIAEKVAGKTKDIDPAAIAASLWTPEVVDARKAELARDRNTPRTPLAEGEERITSQVHVTADGVMRVKTNRTVVLDGREEVIEVKPATLDPGIETVESAIAKVASRNVDVVPVTDAVWTPEKVAERKSALNVQESVNV